LHRRADVDAGEDIGHVHNKPAKSARGKRASCAVAALGVMHTPWLLCLPAPFCDLSALGRDRAVGLCPSALRLEGMNRPGNSA
jgi:hypothetical protein